MEGNEGIRRLRLLGARIMLAGFTVAAALVIIWAIDTFALGRPMTVNAFLVVFIPWVGMFLVGGGAIRVVAWLLEGFLASSRSVYGLPEQPVR